MAAILDLERLTKAVQTDVALRRSARLQPAGGPSDKVFPPTYEGGQYAMEQRVLDGKRVPCALLDSVQSQANRFEAALLMAHRSGTISVPLVEVDFGAVGLPEVGVITSLDAPHRLADAILRDSRNGDEPFRKSAQGKLLDTASVADCTGVFGLCPTALVFGLWDSTGPRGGLGTKFQRLLVSEIVAVDAEPGVRPSSRIDPLGIQLNAGTLFEAEEGWTLDAKAARQEKGKPRKLGKDGKPSEANHGNVTPSLKNEKGQPHHGGVTMAYALQTTVLSLAALRRLRFPLAAGTNDDVAVAARTALAALGLCGAVLSIETGCDLRSRCLLVPADGLAAWEIVHGDGTAEAVSLGADDACRLLIAAVARARDLGLPWRSEPLRLVPSPDLASLVQRSRELATQTAAEE